MMRGAATPLRVLAPFRLFGAVLIAAVLFLGVAFAALAESRAVGRQGMVATSSPEASAVGVQILKAGGNAVDAAVAVGFVLAVTYPEAGNLGGGGFAVVRTPDGAVVTLDHRERAPFTATQDMFLDAAGRLDAQLSLESHLASGTPGSVDGLLVLHERFGKLSRARVLAPAVNLARNGFVLSETLARRIQELLPELRHRPASLQKFSAGGKAYNAGETWRQPDLAKTLQAISDEGRAGFYSGWVANAITAEMAQQGGLIRQPDLDAYASVWRDPIHGRYRGFEVYSMAPPSSGGILLTQMLNMLSAYPVGALQPGSSALIHLMTEVERRAYADRTEYLGDSDFYPVPIQKLIDPGYAQRRMENYDPNKASVSTEIRHGVWQESEQTTHYSVIDRDGMMVALTTTLNSSFGNKWVIPGTGILMNNEMDDFAASTTEANQYGLLGSTANAIAPGKRMLSSMTPTLVLKDNEPVLITGSPGGSTIITTVLQVILNVIDHGQSLADAVAAPRVHHQWQPDVIDFEQDRLSDAVIADLKARGHILQARSAIGVANSILVTEGQFEGVADARDMGAAAGF